MRLSRYLQTKTRQPEFLWRMVIGILVVGVGLGFVAQQVCQPEATKATVEAKKPKPGISWNL